MTRLTIVGGDVDGDGGRWLVDGTLVAPDADEDIATADVVVDAQGLAVTAGWIDLQINGAWGDDFTTDPSSIWAVGRRLPSHGVTTFLPTIVSSDLATVTRTAAALGARPSDYVGADPVGIHVEGPFIAPGRPGAHRPGWIRPPSPALVESWTADRGIRLVTLAPEVPGATSTIRALAEQGVVVAAGHSEAGPDDVAAAIEAGLSAVTHLFNAMSGLDHRRPGLAAEALLTDRLAVTTIVDGIHVAPRMVELAWRLLGPDRLVLVTDAVAALGCAPGRCQLGEVEVVSDGTSVRTLDGVLAGSVLAMPQAISNLVRFAGTTVAEARRAASANPAALLGLADRGELVAGRRGDVTLVDDDGTPVVTICHGVVAHVAPAHRWRVGEGRSSSATPGRGSRPAARGQPASGPRRTGRRGGARPPSPGPAGRTPG